jgi:hypothetical protein
MEHGFGVTADAVLLFNILHCEQPVRLLRHAANALRPGGKVLVIHWRCDIPTPRGPSAAIRPSPQQIIELAASSNLRAGDVIDLPPWHYGMSLSPLHGKQTQASTPT